MDVGRRLTGGWEGGVILCDRNLSIKHTTVPQYGAG